MRNREISHKCRSANSERDQSKAGLFYYLFLRSTLNFERKRGCCFAPDITNQKDVPLECNKWIQNRRRMNCLVSWSNGVQQKRLPLQNKVATNPKFRFCRFGKLSRNDESTSIFWIDLKKWRRKRRQAKCYVCNFTFRGVRNHTRSQIWNCFPKNLRTTAQRKRIGTMPMQKATIGRENKKKCFESD